ncbi:MAG: hypothetical protein ICV60_19600 [Pyrinomonadaceae bacterium]|nr:hypothetical protein [Pyrinomonadaceae bacterium]
MRKIHLSLLLSIVALATGCPKYKPSVDFKDRASFVNKVNEHLKAKQAQYISVLGSNPAMAKTIRNELIEDALPYIDDAYLDYVTDLQAGRDRANFVADLIELGTTAAVGITNGERPLQILGVALTAFRGGRRSADLNFYKEQSTPILINKMDDNRAKVREAILRREKSDVDIYPMGAAIGDIVEYYNAGTLVRAFTQLSKDTAAEAKASEDKVRKLKGVPITEETTQEFRDLSVPAGRILTQLGLDLNSGDQTKIEAATKKMQQIVAALEKDTDAAAVLKAADVSSTDTDGVNLRRGLVKVRRSAAEANNNDLLNTINQAIVDNGR